MLKKLKNAHMYLLIIACVMTIFAGCAATPTAAAPAATETDPVVTTVSETTTPEDGSNDTDDAEDTDDADNADETDDTDDAEDTDDTESAPEETEYPDDSETHSATASPSEPVETEDDIVYDNAFFDRIFATEQLSKLANLKSEPERRDAACVVDLRNDPEAYDVDWDYGAEYNGYINARSWTDWSKIFDVDYYMAQFPMLALQYHYDEEKLLRHFQTVGIHEGRQGSENFNVGAFMDWCDENLEYTKDAFQGDYAMYYMFYINAVDEYPDSFPADGRPAQYKTVMTKAQVREFNGINRLRKEVGLDPYIFDAEMAAFANYRAYVNSDQQLSGHEWLDMTENQNTINLYFTSLHTELLSENTIATDTTTVIDWFMKYKKSQAHYEAMIADDCHYSGSSNLYVCAMDFKGRDQRSSQFDIFSDNISTPTNP